MGYVSLYKYNTQVKISGQDITLKRYKKEQLRGYGKKKTNSQLKVQNDDKWLIELFMNDKVHTHHTQHTVGVQKSLHMIQYSKENGFIDNSQADKLFEQEILNGCNKVIDKELEREERFRKSVLRARENIFDLIGSNVGIWGDTTGKKHKSKFVTLTFNRDMEDIKESNKAFTDFIKRLNYSLFKTKKPILKYVAIPELHDRGTWHYHVLFFNLPLIPVNVDKVNELIQRSILPLDYNKKINLEEIWGNGYVFINVIKDNSKVASYVTKYLTKGIDIAGSQITYKTEGENEGLKRLSDYKLYKRFNLENMKRYQASKGLKKAVKLYMHIEKLDQEALMTMLKDKRNKYLIQLNKEKDTLKRHDYSNEHRGDIIIYNFRIAHKKKYDFYMLLRTLGRAYKHHQKLKTKYIYKAPSDAIDYARLLRLKYLDKYAKQNNTNLYKYLQEVSNGVS